MKTRITLNLNLASRPKRNRRLYAALTGLLAVLLVGLAAGAAFIVMKYGGEAARIKAAAAVSQKTQRDAEREEKRLTADVRKQERLNRTLVDLVNGVILRKTFSWPSLFSEFEKALPGSSFITSFSPGFTPDGALALRLRVTSRSRDDQSAFLAGLLAQGFKDIQVIVESRSDDGRLITEITLSYEHSL